MSTTLADLIESYNAQKAAYESAANAYAAATHDASIDDNLFAAIYDTYNKADAAMQLAARIVYMANGQRMPDSV